MNFFQLWDLKKAEWEEKFPKDLSTLQIEQIFLLTELFIARYEKEKGRIMSADEFLPLLKIAANYFNHKTIKFL